MDTTADGILSPALHAHNPALSGADWSSPTTDNDMDRLNCLVPLFDGSNDCESEAFGPVSSPYAKWWGAHIDESRCLASKTTDQIERETK